MSEPLIGEIRLFPYGWAPEGWVLCDGRQMPIQTFQVLNAVIANTYGGDLRTYFNVPDLRARMAVAPGDNPDDIFDPAIASSGGVEKVTLAVQQMPPHTHALNAAALNTPRSEVATPEGNWIGEPLLVKSKGGEYTNAFAAPGTAPDTLLNQSTLSVYQGGGQPHENRQPYLVLGYYIATQGEFPSRP